MKTFLSALALAALTLLSAGEAAAQPRDVQQLSGVWRNPKNTVHVRIQPCGGNVCGIVTWATPQAIQAARENGTPNLIGTQLFREFRRRSEGYFGGRVFVPDMNRTFSGYLRISNPNIVNVQGCVLAIFCRSQDWVRVR